MDNGNYDGNICQDMIVNVPPSVHQHINTHTHKHNGPSGSQIRNVLFAKVIEKDGQGTYSS